MNEPQSILYKIEHDPWLIGVLRIAIGAVFVFSGFVKAIDPWGSYYKFNEYLLSFGFYDFGNLAKFGAFAVGSVEFLLGVSLIIGAYKRLTTYLLMAMMAFMTPLTLYLAITNRVADCGCFGDALVLSNWASFWKNVVLTIFIAWLCRINKNAVGIYGVAVHWITSIVSFIFIIAIATVGFTMQPLIDFRPYKIGSQLTGADTGEKEEDFVFIYSKNGVEQEFSLDSLPDDDDEWEYVDRRRKPGTEVVARKLGDKSIVIYDNGEDVSDEVLSQQQQQMLIFLFPDIENVDISQTFLINELNEFAQNQGGKVIGLTSGNAKDIEQWQDISMAAYPVYTIDDAELKMIARGNPAVVMLDNSKIIWKRALKSINPDALHNAEATLESINEDFDPHGLLMRIVWTYLAVMLVVFVVNRSYLVAKFSIKSIRGKKIKQ